MGFVPTISPVTGIVGQITRQNIAICEADMLPLDHGEFLIEEA